MALSKKKKKSAGTNERWVSLASDEIQASFQESREFSKGYITCSASVRRKLKAAFRPEQEDKSRPVLPPLRGSEVRRCLPWRTLSEHVVNHNCLRLVEQKCCGP